MTYLADVVHGDIKPQNVLIFADDAGTYTARLSDFGYSTILVNPSEEGQIMLPKSEPWNAPEVIDWATFSFTQAKMADSYSFGMLCLWLLFQNHPPKNATGLGSVYESKRNHGFDWIQKLKQDGELQAFASARIEAITSLNQDQKSDLKSFFASTLTDDPSSRKLELNGVMQPFEHQQYGQHPIMFKR